jgi:hypothetical protein
MSNTRDIFYDAIEDLVPGEVHYFDSYDAVYSGDTDAVMDGDTDCGCVTVTSSGEAPCLLGAIYQMGGGSRRITTFLRFLMRRHVRLKEPTTEATQVEASNREGTSAVSHSAVLEGSHECIFSFAFPDPVETIESIEHAFHPSSDRDQKKSKDAS